MLSSIFHVSRILRVAATCVSLAVTASGLVFAHGVREEITLEGTVRDAAGNAIADAAVTLERVTSDTVPATRTDSNGLFVLKLERADEYKVRVAKEGFRPRIVEVGRFDATKKRIEVTLELAPGNSTTQMEFSDSPNFKVAGVTDWSNAGLHGSDVNVRTSETLTKDAAALKAANSKAEHATGAVDEHRLRGEAHEKSGDPLAAEHEYEMAVKLNPSEENYFAWGTELLLHRAGMAAVQILATASAKYPDSERMREALGAAYYATGQYAEAAQQMCGASDLNPADAEPYLFLGKMEQAAGEILPCSEAKLKRFAETQPGKAHANFYYGLLLWKKARKTQNEIDFDGAERLFQRAVAIEPGYGEVYVELGMLYNARGKYAAALVEFQKATKATPSLSAAHYQLSLAYRRARNIGKADEEMKTYTRLRQSEEAALEKQRREMRQFVMVLKQGQSSAPN